MEEINEEMFSAALKYGFNKVADRIETDESAPSKMLRYMQNGEYSSAVKVSAKKKLTSESDFENVVVFGKAHGVRYPKIKGGMACLAAATAKANSTGGIADSLERAFTEVFTKGGFGGSEVFEQQCGDAKKFKDCVGFILTKDGASMPKKEDGGDQELVKFFQTLKRLSGGTFVLKDFSTKDLVVKGGFVDTVKYLVQNDMVELGKDVEMLADGASAEMSEMLKKRSAHRFRLHEPEIVIDGKTNRPSTASALYAKLFYMGYDVTANKPQTVTVQNASAVVGSLFGVYGKYVRDGENISDNPFESKLKFVSSQIAHLEDADRNGVNVAKEEKTRIDELKGVLEQSVNSLLSSLGLPEVSMAYDSRRSYAVRAMYRFGRSPWNAEYPRHGFRRDDGERSDAHDGKKKAPIIGKAVKAVGGVKTVAKSDVAKDAANGIIKRAFRTAEKRRG